MKLFSCLLVSSLCCITAFTQTRKDSGVLVITLGNDTTFIHKFDILQIPIQVSSLAQHVETLTIDLIPTEGGGNLQVDWEKTRLAIPYRVASPSPEEDAAAVRRLNDDYIRYWLENNEKGLLALFEPEARISPNSLCPIDSIENMSDFWFPKDGSITTIHRYEAQEIGLKLMGDLAVTTQSTVLEWSYRKGDFSMGRIQDGIHTTVFRRQPDGSWKMWRKMWTDVAVRER